MIGGIGKADPALVPVEDIGISLAPGAAPEGGDVAAGFRFRQPEGREFLALRLWPQEAPFLLLGAPLQERQRVEPEVNGEQYPEGGVGALQLLAQQSESEVILPPAPLGLGDAQP